MHETDAGRQALDHVDRTLTARPKRDGHALKSAVECLSAFRDDYVRRHHEAGDGRLRGTLERVNAVISVVLAAQFPIGEVPWDELKKARDWLAAILEEEAVQ